tara:strand:- start:97 stop:672 length:576 start_codon:yes stop_codon:yes gene_type:complete
MRYHFYIYLLLTKIILGQNEVDIRNLQIKDGIYYQPLDVKPYTGKIINVNKNGNIVLETNCDRGKINGIWRAWYDNGKKEFEGYYKNGYRNGLWKAWHDTGQLWKEGYYFFDKKEGTWLYWYLNGNTQELRTYHNGKLNGPIKKWYSNGQQKMEGLYKELSEYEVSSKYGKWVYFLNESGTARISKYYGND